MTQDWHISPNQVGLLICRSGHAEVNLNGRIYQAERGSTFALSPFVTVLSIEGEATWIWFTISQHKAIEITRNAQKAIGSMRLMTNPHTQLAEEDMLFMEEIYERISLREQQLSSALAEDRVLLELEIRLLQQVVVSEMSIRIDREGQQAGALGRDEQLMAQFFQLLLSNYKEHRNVRWYAEQLHLSPQYFSSLIRSASGYTPSEWIVRIVILNAKLLLDRPKSRVKDVAEELGFPEQFTFRKYFKLYTGLSPKQYQTQKQALVSD